EPVREVLTSLPLILGVTRGRGQEDILGRNPADAAPGPLLVEGVVLHDCREHGAAGGVGVLVRGHLDPPGPGFLQQTQRIAHPPPIFFAARLMVRDLYGYPARLAPMHGLADRL